MLVGELMVSQPLVIGPRDMVKEALDILSVNSTNGMPVVGPSKELLGMIVKADIYRFLVAPGHYENCPVEWAMSKPVVCCDYQDQVLEAAKKLRKHDIVAMPVLKEGKVI